MKKILLALVAISLTSCYHMPDQDILQSSNQHYETMKEYYDDIIHCYENDKNFLLKSSDKEFTTYAKLLGQDYQPVLFGVYLASNTQNLVHCIKQLQKFLMI